MPLHDTLGGGERGRRQETEGEEEEGEYSNIMKNTTLVGIVIKIMQYFLDEQTYFISLEKFL